jgi:hypothetical protein
VEAFVTHINPFAFGLDKNSANDVLEHAASVCQNHIAVIHGDWQRFALEDQLINGGHSL